MWGIIGNIYCNFLLYVIDEARVDYTLARGTFRRGSNWSNWLKTGPVYTIEHIRAEWKNINADTYLWMLLGIKVLVWKYENFFFTLRSHLFKIYLMVTIILFFIECIYAISSSFIVRKKKLFVFFSLNKIKFLVFFSFPSRPVLLSFCIFYISKSFVQMDTKTVAVKRVFVWTLSNNVFVLFFVFVFVCFSFVFSFSFSWVN